MEKLKKTGCLSAAFISAALLFTTSANAQFKKGTLMLGTTIGSSAYSSANSDYAYSDGSGRNTGHIPIPSALAPGRGFSLPIRRAWRHAFV